MILSNYHRSILKSLVPGLIFIVIFFTIYAFIPGKGIIVTYTLILSMSFGAKLLEEIRNNTKPVFIKWLKSYIQLSLVVFLFYYAGKALGVYGWIGSSILILAYVIYKLSTKRKQYMEGVREIEKMLFGKTLDKANWVDSKPKMPKFKI